MEQMRSPEYVKSTPLTAIENYLAKTIKSLTNTLFFLSTQYIKQRSQAVKSLVSRTSDTGRFLQVY